jgi:hypothetical protein
VFRADIPDWSGSDALSSSVGAAWDMVRDEMQSGFAQVGETILEAAAGIRQANDIYLHADANNANLLKQYLADPRSHDPNNPAANPPVPGSDDDPGKPALPN